MRMMVRMALLVVVAQPVSWAQEAGDPTADDRESLSRHFGFGPFQTYKVKPGIAQLKLADVNGDGRTDVVLWNPRQSRIELFVQPGREVSGEREAPARERNEVPDRGPMRNRNIPVAYSLAHLEVADVTGDGRADIIFFGEPRELVVLPGRADGDFGPADSIRAPEGEPRGGSMCAGDFNSDGRTDVALIGPELLLIFAQKPGGGLAQPQRILHNIRQPMIMLPADLDGDGREDLIISADDDEYGAHVFLQEQACTLGPLRRVRIPKLRSLTVVRGRGGDDVLAVEYRTGRLVQYRWQLAPESAGGRDWPELLYWMPARGRGRAARGGTLAAGDVNGDGRVDLVASDPESGQLVLFRQAGGGLQPCQSFPGLLRTVDVCVADIDADGRAEILSVSPREKMIGVSRYEGGRLTFPQPLPTQGEPLAVAVGSLDGGRRCLAYARRVEKKVEIAVARLDSLDRPEVVLPVGALEDDVGGLWLADVNQDGRNDLLLFMKFGALRTFLQKEDGSLEVLEGPATNESLVKEVSVAGACLADVTGDGRAELLVAQQNIVRALVVREGRWTAIDQFNPESADAQLTGVAVLPPGPSSAPGSYPSVVTYDRKSRELIVFQRGREDDPSASATYGVARTIPVGAFELNAMLAVPIRRGGRAALVLADPQRLALLLPDEVAPTLVEQHAYETNIKDAWLADAVAGDINHDGVRDVLLIDTRKANIEVLTTLPDGEFVRVLHFQVFQGKRFSAEPDAGGEPREALCGDVTGDGIDDLVLLVHDRLLVYPGM